MDKDEQIRQEAISELEASMGGRFRDGAECPLVFDLYALADADLHHADLHHADLHHAEKTLMLYASIFRFVLGVI